MGGHPQRVAFIWSIAELLRGDYRPAEYGKVILPFVVLRRLDAVLDPTRAAVLKAAAALPATADERMREMLLNRAAGQRFHNSSRFTFDLLKADPAGVADNLRSVVNAFSPSVRDMLVRRFDLLGQVARLDAANLLYLVVQRFAEVDLHPARVSNIEMGYIFEELIRRFSEASNEEAGDHFTPREVIRLMVNLVLCEDTAALTEKGVIRTVYDPACGTGGMLSVTEEYLRELNPSATMVAFGQELNGESYAICNSDLLIKGQDPSNIAFGNSFTEDGHAGKTFDYMLSNPPFGVDWKKVEGEVADEHKKRGFSGRFGPGLPRVSDGSLLFVLHMASKLHRDGRTSRIAVVLNGSPLFTGGAASGESEIRRWLIENDMLEAVVGLPDQLFYNTGISTYVWVITNRKAPGRRGKVQLIDATAMHEKMRRSLGNKRNLIPEAAIAEVTRLFGDMAEGEPSKVFDNEDFGYWRVTVERPLRLSFAITPERIAVLEDVSAFKKLGGSRKKGAAGAQEAAEGQALKRDIPAALHGAAAGTVWKDRDEFADHLRGVFKRAGLKLPTALFEAVLGALGERDETAEPCAKKGRPEPDADLREWENVPLGEDIRAYFEREVLPHAPDAWIDEDKTRKGFEIPFTRHFYRYQAPRPLKEIDADLRRLANEISKMLPEVVA